MVNDLLLISLSLSLSTCSEVAGLFLIDPLFEGLFLNSGKGESDDSAESDAQPRTWSEYWMKRLTPRWTGVWLSAAVGFNRLSLMIGMMSPVEDPKFSEILPSEVILRKVGSDVHQCNSPFSRSTNCLLPPCRNI